ncbi:four helix bundle protein [Candidatus Shapirobacteria bacterium]|nr:four helix bundle protein [Candidatus Shapirobacteria bacterium]
MKFTSFEDIKVWQMSRDFNIAIFNSFTNCKDYSFKDQLLRASVSIMNNIAEGFERGSNPDFKKFLYISKGSAGEVRSMIYLAQGLNYLSPTKSQEFIDLSLQIAKMLSGLIKVL